ncbi:MAG: FAD binding domain-containing protein, partial [Paracoccaceae bacterium]|nr:FAD binding domain-containing protein [Paracoccaceae bacterium]
GAAASWTEIARADLPPAFDGLKAAAREVGSAQIQNSGTLGGNLCNASPAADGLPCLLTLDAEVELVSARGSRLMPLSGFVTGPRRTALEPGEILAAVNVPRASGAGQGSFVKLGARRYLVISIAMAAARVEAEGGRILRAALSVGACSPVAVRLPALEAALAGASVAEAVARVVPGLVAPALAPISDVRAEAGYRAEAAVEILRRALAEALAAVARAA